MNMNFNGFSMNVDFLSGEISSLVLSGKERIFAKTELFTVRLRDRAGKEYIVGAHDAKNVKLTEDGAVYGGFPEALGAARVHLSNEGGNAAWRIELEPESEYFTEWVDFPPITLPALRDNNTEGNGGRILFPYNEGALISDMDFREESFLHCFEPEYPSRGLYTMFPNMIQSQLIAYLFEEAGLYIGAHDSARGVKDINFMKNEGGIKLRFRLFCGTDFGEKFSTGYPIIFASTDERWESAAEIYRAWFEENLPRGVKKISENPALPKWYEDAPLIVTYPVRGIHDTDIMNPNKLYPYTNALPMIDEIREATDSRLLVLLMHWEGTAPWAPPYVWPPYGGVENFNKFMSALHQNGDLLGVYCSGFGYTKQSNLVSEYNCEAEYESEGLERGMCVGPDGKVAISNICTEQRSGYDICPASEVGREILRKAYTPLLESDIDYVQILDQNHGGGQYFCYSRDHGHAPGPGAWMTENMQDMLSEWNGIAGKTIFGCESAAAEPFIANIPFSDNRFELSYNFAMPVPLYSYVYHEYLRNFMGNQVCCPFVSHQDTMRHRLAYSFAAGDSMTLVMTEDGEIMPNWGTRDFKHVPDKAKTLQFIANVTRAYKEELKPYLLNGRMIPAPKISCESERFDLSGRDRSLELPTVYSSAWESQDGSRALILVNPTDVERECKIDGVSVTLAPLCVTKISL